MAEYIVSLVIENVATQLIEETLSLSKFHTQVEWIESELRRIQCFLKDADSKHDTDSRIRNWVAEIRDVACDTDDVIDACVARKTTTRQGQNRLVECFSRYFCVSLLSDYKVHRRIDRIKTRLHDISDSRSTYGIENIGKTVIVSDRRELRERRRSSPRGFDDDDVVGLVGDVNALEDRLIRGEPWRSVVSITGMAGSGKTTLAKKIYHSNNIKRHFDCCAWVYVSQEYRAEEVLRDLAKRLVGFRKPESEKMDRAELAEELSGYLCNRRYLIILDDIWKKQVWNNLREAFPDGKNGSRVVFTTRFKAVGIDADPRSPPHEMSLLSDEDSWKLLSRKVCLEWNSVASLPPWSEDLGKQIAKKCGGLPLAIEVIGGLLSTRDASYTEWTKVLRSVHWQLKQDPIQCEDILALSYFDLPFYLKPCFLYFGLFPEDFEISARRLVLLWIAEGFVQPRGHQPLEDVAEDYLEELVGRSMVQVAATKSNGRLKTCRVHDLLREFAVTKAKEDRFFDTFRDESAFDSRRWLGRARRVAIHFTDFPSTKKPDKLRSLLCFDLNGPIVVEAERFKLLRVLDLEGCFVAKLSSAVGKLVHLRYLGLRGTWLKKLPSSLRCLKNLQTLDLRSTLVNPFPAEIFRLKQMRHLYFSEFQQVILIPQTNDKYLENLQTMSGLYVSESHSSVIEGFFSNLTTLRDLNLHGFLCLLKEQLEKWIFNMKGLESLKLNATSTKIEDITTTAIPNWDFSSLTRLCKLHLNGTVARMFDEQRFPANLAELCLKNSFLMDDPLEKLEKLKSLRVLKLKQSAFVGREMSCSEGGFPQLQTLKLSFIYSVNKWRIEEGAMPSLQRLEIIDCKRLKIVPRGLWPVNSLRDLKLGFLPADYEDKIQERRGENWYRIQHVLPI